MKPIKVLVLTTSYPLTKDSVSGLFVKRLVDHLPDFIEPKVIAPCGDNSDKMMRELGYEVKCFKYAPRKFRTLAHKPGGIPATIQSNPLAILAIPFFLVSMFIKCFIEARHVDVIHANWSGCGMVAGIVGKILSIPSITTIRGEDGNKADVNFLFKTILKITMVLNYRIVSVSDDLSDKIRLLSITDNGKVVCIPNGVQGELVDYKKQFFRENLNKVVLITVGNLTLNKNTSLIIDAMHELKSINKKKLFLNIVGDGPEKDNLQSLAVKYNLTENVKFWGNLQPDKVFKLIAESNIFVLPSYREGRPNVLLESMAIGTPIVASNINGVKEIVKNEVSGLLFDPDKTIELSSCIKRLVGNNNLEETICGNAKNYIIENDLFWRASAAKYVEIYKTAIERN